MNNDKLKKTKTVIFDFDGTIVESLPVIYDNLLHYINARQINPETLRDLASHEVIKTLKIPATDLPKLIIKIRNEFKNNLIKQSIVKEINDVILFLVKSNLKLHIVSSNSKENIELFLKRYDLCNCFDTITSFFTIFGKAYGINKIIQKLQINRKNIYYIGDETRDIEAAQKIGIKSIAVCWGYNSEKILTDYHPDFLAKIPTDLIKILS